jgi:hypothetical protein
MSFGTPPKENRDRAMSENFPRNACARPAVQVMSCTGDRVDPVLLGGMLYRYRRVADVVCGRLNVEVIPPFPRGDMFQVCVRPTGCLQLGIRVQIIEHGESRVANQDQLASLAGQSDGIGENRGSEFAAVKRY